jgi:hypothetical protein
VPVVIGYLDRVAAVKLTQSEPVECFKGYHNVVVAFAILGIWRLYPAAMLTRPMFQALDQKLAITFDYQYLFVFAQIQTVLLVASSFFPTRAVFLLCLCFVADLILVWYFWKKQPCTAPVLNTLALLAFGFSTWLNVASLIVVFLGDDSAPSIMMFCYIAMAFWMLIRGLQKAWLPSKDFVHLSKLTGESAMQLAISIRTEFAIRLMNLITDAEFWAEIVAQTEPGAWREWSTGGIICSAVFFLNCALTAFSLLYFGVQKFRKPMGSDAVELILRTTVAMVVFDTTDVFTTLIYDDEREGPISKDAWLSAFFSAASALYGLFGRKKDLKETRERTLLQAQQASGSNIVEQNSPLIEAVELNDNTEGERERHVIDIGETAAI